MPDDRPATRPFGREDFEEIDRLLDRMIELQREKTLEVARKKVPYLTNDDIMNPEGFPAIYEDGPFNYEDGITNGLLSAQIAIRAWLRRSEG